MLLKDVSYFIAGCFDLLWNELVFGLSLILIWRVEKLIIIRRHSIFKSLIAIFTMILFNHLILFCTFYFICDWFVMTTQVLLAKEFIVFERLFPITSAIIFSTFTSGSHHFRDWLLHELAIVVVLFLFHWAIRVMFGSRSQFLIGLIHRSFSLRIINIIAA